MPENTEKQTSSFIQPSLVDPNELAKAFQDEGIIPAEQQENGSEKQGTAQKEPAKAEKPAERQEKLSDDTPALLRIAAEKAAKRREAEAARPRQEVDSVFTPQELQRLAAARKSGNPVDALAAMGFTHTQYNAAVTGMKSEEKSAETEPADDKYTALQKEIADLKARAQNEEISRQRVQLFDQMKATLKDDPKFQYVNSLEDYEGVERVIIEFHRETGELPGSNLAESVKLAAEVVEARLRKEAEKWKKVSGGLTHPASGAPVPSKAPEQSPATGSAAPRTLTNANTTAPAATRPPPKSREEIINAILDGREEELES